MSGKLLKKYSAVEGGFSYVGAVAAFLVVTVIYSFAVGALEEGSAVYEVVSFLFNILIQLCFLVAALLPARNLGSRMTYTSCGCPDCGRAAAPPRGSTAV